MRVAGMSEREEAAARAVLEDSHGRQWTGEGSRDEDAALDAARVALAAADVWDAEHGYQRVRERAGFTLGNERLDRMLKRVGEQ